MCDLFDSLQAKSKRSSTVVGLFIAGVNFLFRSIMIYFTNLLKPETQTIETNQVKTAVFLVTFMNSGILIMLMSAYS